MLWVSLVFGCLLALFVIQCRGQFEICSACARECDLDTFKLGSKRMLMFHKEDTWENAKRKCEQLGMFLVSPATEEENGLLRDFLNKRIYGDQINPTWRGWNLWLGGSDQEIEGTFKWHSQAPYNYSNFKKPNEPNGGTSENCMEVHTVTQKDLLWNDADCGIRNTFICEITDSGLSFE